MKLIRDLAITLCTVHYSYGGTIPAGGLDCSELVQILLNAGGADLPGDQTAQGLFDHFSKPPNHVSQDPQLGSLVFYGHSKKKIQHVAMCLDRKRMVEAGGGTDQTKLLSDAIRDRASVRIVPIRSTILLGIYLPEFPAAEGT